MGAACAPPATANAASTSAYRSAWKTLVAMIPPLIDRARVCRSSCRSRTVDAARSVRGSPGSDKPLKPNDILPCGPQSAEAGVIFFDNLEAVGLGALNRIGCALHGLPEPDRVGN